MSTFLSQIINFLVQTVVGLYLLAVLLRFILQLVRADFFNPLSQIIIKITRPLLSPLRKIIPTTQVFDFASIALAVLVYLALLYLTLLMQGIPVDFLPVGNAVLAALLGVALMFINIFMFALFIIAIASWISPRSYNPGLLLLQQIVEPLSSRARRLIPPLGGLDFSVMILLFAIYFIKQYVLFPLLVSSVPPFVLQSMILF